MLERTKVKIIGGAATRKEKIGVVMTSFGTGKNIGKVEIYIDRLGDFWYDPKDLEIIEEQEPKTTKEKFTVGFFDVDPAELKPHPTNPKIYGEDEDISDLIELISESGFDERLIVNTKGEIVSGNRRNRTALKLELATVPIEVRAFESISEEIRFLLSKNATRTKTVFQKVREGQQWQAIESNLAAARKRATQNNEAARAEVENFPPLGLSGKTRDIIAKRVGLGSGRNYEKAVKVVEEIDRLFANAQTEIAFAYKEILNRPSVDGAYKLLSQSQSERERILEIFSENKALSLKEAIKLLKDLNPPPETEVLAEGIRIMVDRTSPICPDLRGEITSLPNSSSAIVLFEDGTRQMVDRGYIKPALENLPQSLIDRVNKESEVRSQESGVSGTKLVQQSSTIDTSSQSISTIKTNENNSQPGKLLTPDSKLLTPIDEPKSVKEELDKKQEELGLGKGRNSVLPESDRLDELQHSNPTDIDDRPFAPPLAFTEEDSRELTTLVANIKKTVKFLRKEDYRSIGDAIVQNKPEGAEEMIKAFAKNRDTARLMVLELKLLHPDLLE